jgi:hypothetical protein
MYAMKKNRFSQLLKAVAKINEKLTDIERRLNEKFNEPNLKFKRTSAFKTLYYFNIALTLITIVIDFIVKLVEVYNKLP